MPDIPAEAYTAAYRAVGLTTEAATHRYACALEAAYPLIAAHVLREAVHKLGFTLNDGYLTRVVLESAMVFEAAMYEREAGSDG